MRRLLLLIAILAALSLSATAGAVVLNFEGLQDQEQVLNFYNGGLGGNGSGPGPSDGITFDTNALALISDQNGGSGDFAGEPSCCTAFFLTGTDSVMNVAGGFTTGLSLFYSAVSDPGVVSIYSGLNDTGTLLATLNLPATGDGLGVGTCGLDDFCPFVSAAVAFAGTAMSVDFSGTASQIAFDDVTLQGTPDATVTGTPEPGGFSLLALGLVSLMAIAMRRRKLEA
jgi:hypothetical protein